MDTLEETTTLRKGRLVAELFQAEYRDIRLYDNDLWAATVRFMFTYAIVVGVQGRITYEDRWCYKDHASALAALDAWDGQYHRFDPKRTPRASHETGEPIGWHRHPMSGRRVSEEGEEYVNP